MTQAAEETALDNDVRQQFLEAAFNEILFQERVISQVATEMTTVTTELKIRQNQAEALASKAWEQIASLMAETGEFEVLLKGEGCDYKINYSTPRKSVEVDDDAVPKEYCKEVLKPKLKEIKELLDSGAQVNWARFKEGEKKLQWKAVKPS